MGSPWPIPTWKAPTCWPCRPASNCRSRPCHWRRKPTSRCSSCSVNRSSPEAETSAGSRTLNAPFTVFRNDRDNPESEAVMALKVELKPGERVIIGDCVVTNADQRTRLLIEGDTPILREKDILTGETANTPAKRIYLCVQLMYLSKDPHVHHETYFTLMRDIVQAAPSTWPYIEVINNSILTGEFYKALKATKKLIAYEQELLDNAARNASLQGRGDGDRKSA